MSTRTSKTSGGVANAAKTSASKAAVARSRSQSRSDGTDGTRPSLSTKAVRIVSGSGTVGQKGKATASVPRASKATGHAAGRDYAPPKLGRATAVSGGPKTSYGTAAARNHSQAGASGAVSGKSVSYGTAPAKNVTKGAYGTWTGK